MRVVIEQSFFEELTKISTSQEKHASGIKALLRDMDKVAASLGFAAARAGNGVNPTMAGVDQAQTAYHGLDAGTKKLIENHPLVSQHGMAPHAAMQVAGWSMKPGQSVGDFFAQQHMGSIQANNMAGGGAPRPAASAAGAATNPGAARPAPAATMATNPGRAPMAAPAATAYGAPSKVTVPGKIMPAIGAAPAAAGALNKAAPALSKGLGTVAKGPAGLRAIASGALQHLPHP